MENKIAELRKEKGLTQVALADKVGISEFYLGQLEQGKRNPTIGVAYKIAQALDVNCVTIYPFLGC